MKRVCLKNRMKDRENGLGEGGGGGNLCCFRKLLKMETSFGRTPAGCFAPGQPIEIAKCDCCCRPSLHTHTARQIEMKCKSIFADWLKNGANWILDPVAAESWVGKIAPPLSFFLLFFRSCVCQNRTMGILHFHVQPSGIIGRLVGRGNSRSNSQDRQTSNDENPDTFLENRSGDSQEMRRETKKLLLRQKSLFSLCMKVDRRSFKLLLQ